MREKSRNSGYHFEKELASVCRQRVPGEAKQNLYAASIADHVIDECLVRILVGGVRVVETRTVNKVGPLFGIESWRLSAASHICADGKHRPVVVDERLGSHHSGIFMVPLD